MSLGRKYLAHFPKNQADKKYGIELPLYKEGLPVPQSDTYFREATTLMNVLNVWLKIMTGYTVTIKENSNQKFLEIIQPFHLHYTHNTQSKIARALKAYEKRL